jgi:ABC-type bacteriocin/lantibiotic exporters, contain an N-terminal double-glycine peptidase domain
MNEKDKELKKVFVKQVNQSWCGLACLSMVTKYFGGEIPQDKLLNISGTNVSGTTLLGLYQAANHIGLEAEGLAGNVEELAKLDNPAILHFILEGGLQHYIVYFGMSDGKFVITDPANPAGGISYMDRAELEKLWKSKTLLSVKRGAKFKSKADVGRGKVMWLKSLVKPDTQILTAVMVLSIIFSALGISLALFSQKLIDDILPTREISRLIMGVVILALILFFKNVIGYLRTILSARQVRDFANRIVGQFYSIILYLPKLFFDSLKTGEVTARLNDASRIQRTISYITGTFIIDILTLIIVNVVLFFYWWPIGVITIIGSIIFALLFFKKANKILLKQKDVMVGYAQSESFFFDSVQGVDVIKSFGREKFFSTAGSGVYSVFQNSIFNLTIFSNKIGLWAQNIVVLTIISVISFGSYGVISDVITMGALMAIITFSNTILASISSLMGAYFTYKEAEVAYNRLYEFVGADKESDYEDIERNSENMAREHNGEYVNYKEVKRNKIEVEKLEFNNVSFRYVGRPLIIKGLNFTAKKGKVNVIAGDIGSGKSTLLNLVLRFYEPETGKIEVDGENIATFNLHLWRNSVGFMSQSIKIFNSTLIENVCLSSERGELEKAINLSNELGITKYFNELPLGFLTKIGEDGINLSGGQRQLLGLCRALYSNPAVLLLDEPTNNMDAKSISLFWEIISREKNRRVSILVTHERAIIEKADSVCYIER